MTAVGARRGTKKGLSIRDRQAFFATGPFDRLGEEATELSGYCGAGQMLAQACAMDAHGTAWRHETQEGLFAQ